MRRFLRFPAGGRKEEAGGWFTRLGAFWFCVCRVVSRQTASSAGFLPSGCGDCGARKAWAEPDSHGFFRRPLKRLFHAETGSQSASPGGAATFVFRPRRVTSGRVPGRIALSAGKARRLLPGVGVAETQRGSSAGPGHSNRSSSRIMLPREQSDSPGQLSGR